MVRIVGVNISDNKHTVISLTAIYGVGCVQAKNICQKTGIIPECIVKNLTKSELERIRTEVSKLKVEGDLRRIVSMNIKRLLEIGSYRGVRHKRGLPVRGQRTKTNAMTRKSKKR